MYVATYVTTYRDHKDVPTNHPQLTHVTYICIGHYMHGMCKRQGKAKQTTKYPTYQHEGAEFLTPKQIKT